MNWVAWKSAPKAMIMSLSHTLNQNKYYFLKKFHANIESKFKQIYIT